MAEITCMMMRSKDQSVQPSPPEIRIFSYFSWAIASFRMLTLSASRAKGDSVDRSSVRSVPSVFQMFILVGAVLAAARGAGSVFSLESSRMGEIRA